jgi:hypothetical protein
MSQYWAVVGSMAQFWKVTVTPDWTSMGPVSLTPL